MTSHKHAKGKAYSFLDEPYGFVSGPCTYAAQATEPDTDDPIERIVQAKASLERLKQQLGEMAQAIIMPVRYVKALQNAIEEVNQCLSGERVFVPDLIVNGGQFAGMRVFTYRDPVERNAVLQFLHLQGIRRVIELSEGEQT